MANECAASSEFVPIMLLPSRPIPPSSTAVFQDDGENTCSHRDEFDSRTETNIPRNYSSILEAVPTALGWTSEVNDAVLRLYQAAKHLQKGSSSEGSIHCMVTRTIDSRNITLYPLYSSLFESALQESNPRSSIAIQAISDSLLLKAKVANRCTIPRCSLGTSRSEIDWPSWFASKLIQEEMF